MGKRSKTVSNVPGPRRYEATFNSNLIESCLPHADGSLVAVEKGDLANGDGNSRRTVASNIGKISAAIAR